MTAETPTYQTAIEVKAEIESLKADVRTVKAMCRRLRLTEATLLRLKPGDILVMNTTRPLATSEQQMITEEFKTVCQSLGIQNVHLMVICGEEVRFSVVRQETSG